MDNQIETKYLVCALYGSTYTEEIIAITDRGIIQHTKLGKRMFHDPENISLKPKHEENLKNYLGS
ncbi:hypothetical protein ES754_01315 [Psychrobacter frigidicola]|uniref:Uncharacterized protein n=1 Tax=Psychrobacter frigidicola TaxID=45611 RepID=A0A5C7A4Z7_9GAMM|nr:hypothetical protein [Psychrobacter frigidicola]TXD97654.1 hypothetical protein ES754_01315 [Psychrobacter frigidicola]